MTESEALLIRNLLNGVPAADAARAAGMPEEDALAAFTEAMKRVAEYRVVHCMPFFECGTLLHARGARLMVLEALDRIGRWDDGERDLMIAFFKGERPQAAAADLKRVFEGTLLAIPYYLDKTEHRPWHVDRKGFIATRRHRVLEILERFVSFRTPLLYKKLEHCALTPDTVQQVELYAASRY